METLLLQIWDAIVVVGLTKSEINPNLHAERRLPRGRSLLIIGVLSALSWLVLIALFMALRALI
jgi:hypothetical protein